MDRLQFCSDHFRSSQNHLRLKNIPRRWSLQWRRVSSCTEKSVTFCWTNLLRARVLFLYLHVSGFVDGLLSGEICGHPQQGRALDLSSSERDSGQLESWPQQGDSSGSLWKQKFHASSRYRTSTGQPRRAQDIHKPGWDSKPFLWNCWRWPPT